MPERRAEIPTAAASRYLQQLCKHWSHKFPVEFTPTHGEITLPFGACVLDADQEALKVSLSCRGRSEPAPVPGGGGGAYQALRLSRDADVSLGRRRRPGMNRTLRHPRLFRATGRQPNLRQAQSQEAVGVREHHLLQNIVSEAELEVVVGGLRHCAKRIGRPEGDLVAESAIGGFDVELPSRLEDVHVRHDRDVGVPERDADDFADARPSAVMHDDAQP